MKRFLIIPAGLLGLLLVVQPYSLQTGKKYNFHFKDGQHLRNATLLEENETQYRVRLDYISDEKLLEKKDLKDQPVLAHSLLVTPDTGTPLSKLDSISISFAEPTIGADDARNYQLSGSALGSLKIVSVRQTAKFRYDLQLAGQPADGNLVIKMLNITDNVGAQLTSDSFEYKIDLTNPRVETAPANASAVRELGGVSLLFSEEVVGAGELRNYALSGSGLGSLRATKIEADPQIPHKFTLSFSGRYRNGQIRLQLNNIADRAGNALASPALAFTIDDQPPTMTAKPAPNTLLHEMKSVELNFSEAVSGADQAESYTLAGPGKGDLRVHEIVRLADRQYRVHFSGSPANGRFSIELTGVRDPAGNALTGNNLVYDTDVTAPTLSAAPPTGTPLSQLKRVEIEFSEPVAGAADLRNYALQGNGVGTLSLRKVRPLNDRRYELQFSGTPANGLISLRLKNVLDPAGNALQTDAIEYTADTTPPVFTSLPATGTVLNALREIELTFSETVKGADRPESYSVTGDGAQLLRLVTVTQLPDNKYRLTFSGETRNGRIVLRTQNITDTAGNPVSTGAVDFSADIHPPFVKSISPAAGTYLRALQAIELIFSEAVSGSEDAQNFSWSGEGKGSLRVTTATVLPGNRVQLALDGEPSEGKVTLRFNNLKDRAQNALTTASVDYYIDSVAPVFHADLPAGIVVSELKNISVQFSEPVTGADKAGNYRISGPGAGNLRADRTEIGQSGIHRIHFTGSPADGEIVLHLLNIRDRAGNPLKDNFLAFNADITPPRYSSTPREQQPLSRLNEIQLQFTEPVIGADQVENYLLTGDGLGTLKVARAQCLPNNSCKIELSGNPGNGRFTLQLTNVTDGAGNAPQKNLLAFMADTNPPSFEVTPKNGALAREFSAIQVSFSKPVFGAAQKENYALSGEGLGNLSIAKVEVISATQYQLLLSGSPQSGAIHLGLGNIADAAGNMVQPRDIVYHADIDRPVCTATPQPQDPLNGLTEVTLQFSKPVTGADQVANYRLSGSGRGSLRLDKISRAGNNTYVLAFSGTAAHGELSVSMENIADAAGNTLNSKSFLYQIDRRAVEVVARPAHRSKLVSLSEIELKFSKEQNGAQDLANYSVTGEFAENLRVTAVEAKGNNAYILRFSGDASGAVQIVIQNVRDKAGNALKNGRLEYIIEIPTASQPAGDVVR